MASVESKEFAQYNKIFPELTPTQSITSIMFSMGLPITTISELRGVSDDTVRKSLQEARQKLDLSNISSLRGVVQVRLTMAMMGMHIGNLNKQL
ncbi:transcriptional regulator [Serratia sp. S1B]|nr:transcriptional regulator [Serratia sp. S1B]